MFSALFGKRWTDMDMPYKVTISKDQLTASIELISPISANFSTTESELNSLLTQAKVVFGIDQQILADLVSYPMTIQFPVIIAKGIPPKHGEDAYITIEKQEKEVKKREKINFRNVMEIPSVNLGEIIAKSVPETFGVNGKAVTGKVLAARNGKPLMMRAGKNVIKDGNNFYATIAGQVCITNKMIVVNPVFEVKGDLDLKTGNINFIGNVVIHGNVPTGYEVIAGGDIKIHGLVEGATLEAKGNIFIAGGITGGNRGSVVAEGNIQANYLNQANVKAGQDVLINASSLHSHVEAGGSILCKNGQIIGGSLISGRDIHVKALGNHLFTKTEVSIGKDPLLEEKEQLLTKEITDISANVDKLNEIEMKLLVAAKQRGFLTDNEKELIMKQRHTKNQLVSQLELLKHELFEVEEERELKARYSIFIYDKIYPNTIFQFGKYSRSIQKIHSYVRFFAENGEMKFEPLTPGAR